MAEKMDFSLEKLDEFIEYKNKLFQNKKLFGSGEVEFIQLINSMNDLYFFIKENIDSFYGDKKFLDIYKKYIIRGLYSCEHQLRNINIIDYIFDFDEEAEIHYKDSLSCEEIIKFIVYCERKRIVTENHGKKLQDIDLTSQCLDSSYYIKKHCDELGIKCERLRINPSFYENENIMVNGFHYFCLVYLKEKQYLLDCSYPQFFYLDANLPNRLGIPLLSGCYVGYYMVVNENRKLLALELLEKGYIEFSDKNIKNYFDGFAISYRNGLYYENLGRVEYDTFYTAEDYLRFIYTEDNQYNYEETSLLGYQRYPLKDCRIDFNKIYTK